MLQACWLTKLFAKRRAFGVCLGLYMIDNHLEMTSQMMENSQYKWDNWKILIMLYNQAKTTMLACAEEWVQTLNCSSAWKSHLRASQAMDWFSLVVAYWWIRACRFCSKPQFVKLWILFVISMSILSLPTMTTHFSPYLSTVWFWEPEWATGGAKCPANLELGIKQR